MDEKFTGIELKGDTSLFNVFLNVQSTQFNSLNCFTQSCSNIFLSYFILHTTSRAFQKTKIS